MDKLRFPEQCADPRGIKDFLRQSRRVSDDNIRNRLAQQPCDLALNDVFREWQKRDAILNFCANLIGAPLSPSASVSIEERENSISQLSNRSRLKVQFQSRDHDPRIDPYAARDEMAPHLAAEAELKQRILSWVTEERFTEDIARDTTKGTLASRCGGLGSIKTEFDESYMKFLESANPFGK